MQRRKSAGESNLRQLPSLEDLLPGWRVEHLKARILRCQPTGGSFFQVPVDHSTGDDRDRTDNPLLAKQVLSQLSYVPGKLTAFSTQPTGFPRAEG